LFMNQSLSFCRCAGRFDCPSTECSCKTTYIRMHMEKQFYTYIGTIISLCNTTKPNTVLFSASRKLRWHYKMNNSWLLERI
jgi:hypothetical protein